MLTIHSAPTTSDLKKRAHILPTCHLHTRPYTTDNMHGHRDYSMGAHYDLGRYPESGRSTFWYVLRCRRLHASDVGLQSSKNSRNLCSRSGVSLTNIL